MRLQSKKSNLPALPPSIAAVFLLSLVYWIYLSLTTSMVIIFDAAGYRDLGRMIQTQGWIPYFTTGPNREPIYPFLVAVSMGIEHLTGLTFLRIMAFFGVIILFLTQFLSYQILRLLNVRNGICILILTYMGLSPGLNNAAFSLFSEITLFPIILGIILMGFLTWEAIKENKNLKALWGSSLLGGLLLAATLIKAVFELITPVFLIIFFTTVFLNKKTKKTTLLLLCTAIAINIFYVPISGYKWLNWRYNGNFVVTNRGPWFLYGNTARRMEPLTPKKFAEALAFVPGEGVCNNLFGAKACYFWSFQKADELGQAKQSELNRQFLSPEKIDPALIKLSAQKALENPFQYTVMTIIEGIKMFFWESTKVGFVSYPPWLGKIYNIKIFNNGLRFIVSLMSLMAVMSLCLGGWTPRRSPVGFLMGLLIFLYTLSFSFFCVLTRYALPMAPLYLIAIGIWADQILPPKNQNKI